MIDLMVLAKSLSSLTGTQMINKLDHAKRRGEREKAGERRKRKKAGEKGRGGGSRKEGRKGGRGWGRGKTVGEGEERYTCMKCSIIHNLNPELFKRLWEARI